MNSKKKEEGRGGGFGATCCMRGTLSREGKVGSRKRGWNTK